MIQYGPIFCKIDFLGIVPYFLFSFMLILIIIMLTIIFTTDLKLCFSE